MSEATTTRDILVDLPDYPAGEVEFNLLTNFAAAGTEGFPRKVYTLTLSGTGAGTQALPVPSSDSWLWMVTLPDGLRYSATLASGADLQLTTWLVSALSTETAASLVDQFAALVGSDDIEIQDPAAGLILQDTNTVRYRVTVNTSGALVVTAL